MKVVSSLSPHRIERQQKCVQSWVAMGFNVTCVQAEDSVTESMRESFPQVNFVETNKTGVQFGKPNHVRVAALLDQCTSDPILITNSDIEFDGDPDKFQGRWKAPEFGTMLCGVRYDVDPKKGTKLFKWGIDAFVITPEIASQLPDIGMAIGIPCWDYWIPLHFHKRGWKLLTNKSEGLMHEAHVQNWSAEDSRIGYRILQQHYQMTEKQIVHLIQTITGRKHLR